MFEPEKATEALLYAANRVRDGDMYSVLKVLYLADKLHLYKYGRFIFGDSHSALDYGPVPQGAYDLVKFVAGRNVHCVYPEVAASMEMRGTTIVAFRDADADAFSVSDIDCLNEAIEKYGHLQFNAIKAESHDAAYDATPKYATISIDAIAAMGPDPVTLIQYLSDQAPDRE